ncbi:two-component system, chemotaxis family, CheB/CheR fusion protein [Allopseudospirillum japonicum]|uniref:protein-glutamate O-methyltransferase n=1 Tax=Allopseudospirillum japonicum TaxID=64971 RepID=A0A1H6Q0G2_9GAMM|nr:chemotaxis protein CheB [Allopseudospirillum japonicum]SEI37349.1 two-component system, chemotaxis family, CheB/CheR fusion protein [Allopseudospirillum japonicum]
MDSSAVFSGYLVAIGASAGGLEALEKFFQYCPAHSGAAFVVIQHLSPDHKSMMADLLARHTNMPIKTASHGMPIKANHIYLIPAGKILTINQLGFIVKEKALHTLVLPIDIFFNSIAEIYGARALGIILSGTGSDGTRGAVAINAHGGFLLAQHPDEAKFNGMPTSLIATSLVDEVAPVKQLAERLNHYLNRTHDHKSSGIILQKINQQTDEESLEFIFQLLLQAGGIDFHDYKPATVLRRLERRMQLVQSSTLDEYLSYLQVNRSELAQLRRELLISVTSFFRDPDAFDELKHKVIWPIVSQTPQNQEIRIWCAGISRGEEAYSIAILFLEAFEALESWRNIKIFATDVNQKNIESASNGEYPEAITNELSSERLQTFFNRTDKGYLVKPELRQTIVFARHNLLTDPPFTRMDLVTCRNTLIYFKPNAQKRALHRLEYAIKPKGFLFLGSSESINDAGLSLTAVSDKCKIFQRHPYETNKNINEDSIRRSKYQRNLGSYHTNTSTHTAHTTNQQDLDIWATEKAGNILLDHYTPPALLFNKKLEAIHLFGNISPFLSLRSGAPSMELNKILPENLISVIRVLIYKSQKEKINFSSDTLSVSLKNQQQQILRISVYPLIEDSQAYTLVCFEIAPYLKEDTSEQKFNFPLSSIQQEAQTHIELLEQELSITRKNLQSSIEDLETSNEELQATNEELLSSNEELQSANEELQSVNEELNTVNAEYQEKVLLLNQLNAELESMARASGIATLFVDESLYLTRFTPDAKNIFKLREMDIGRPLDDISHRLNTQNLIDDFKFTLSTERMVEKEVSSEDGHLFLLRLLPYKVAACNTKGAVATFVDITAFQNTRKLQSVINALPERIAVLEHDGRISLMNQAWQENIPSQVNTKMPYAPLDYNFLEIYKQDLNEESQAIYQGIQDIMCRKIASFHKQSQISQSIIRLIPIEGQHEYGFLVSYQDFN